MMDAFCCCSCVSVMLRGEEKKKKERNKKKKRAYWWNQAAFMFCIYSALSWLSWSAITGTCNRFSPAVISRRNVDHRWLGSHRETDGCVSPSWDAVQSSAEEKCFWHLDVDLGPPQHHHHHHNGINLSFNEITCWIRHTLTTVHQLKMLP